MFFDRIIHGTQYFRAPTPLADEWETDLSRFEGFGLDAFQIRINWRWYERKEGEYDFSDIDRLLELAKKYDRKVIMKFMLECAPQYVFDKYGADRIGPKGERLRGGSHGAFYGGWMPCFTNPHVQKAAVRFVEKVTERYVGHPQIILWNTWNEIRNRPLESCFCPHCHAAFSEHLKKKFGTIEALNEFYGTAEESFETIPLPSMPHGHWDIYEFKKFKGSDELYSLLRLVYEAIRKYDSKRPIMAHVGITSAYQRYIGDVCDDYTVSKAVDFWGTSNPCNSVMTVPEARMEYMMLQDFLRSVDENYFNHELYPGQGMFKLTYDTPFDMRCKLYMAIAFGSKGLLYWEYRAERVGHESDSAGLCRADGTPREVMEAVKRFSEEIEEHTELFAKAHAQHSKIAIVYDFDSQLLSEIEDICGGDYSFDLYRAVFHYYYAHTGMYRLTHNTNYPVDYVSSTQPEKFKNYSVLYFPYHCMLREDIVPYLRDFLENGGTVIADEGFGMRLPNTWFNPYDINCKEIMTARLLERRFVTEEYVQIGEESVKISPFKTQYRMEGAETHLTFADGTPALQSVACGKGRLYLSGFSLGYTYAHTYSEALENLLVSLFQEAGVQPYSFADCKHGIYEKRLYVEDKTILFLFNCTDEEKTFPVGQDVVVGAGCTYQDGNITVPPMECAYCIMRADKEE